MTSFLFGSFFLGNLRDGLCYKLSKSTLSVLFFIMCGFHTFAQNKPVLFQSPLWLKSDDVQPKGDKLALATQEEQLKQYFNFNEILPFSKSKFAQKTKNIVANQSSLFVVYKGQSQEIDLVQLQKGNFKVQLTSKKIQLDKEIQLNKTTPENGMIVSCFFNKNAIISKKLGTLTLSDALYQDAKGENQIMELIYLPAFLTGLEKNKIESYLALKYGISLLGNKNYYASSGQKIWDAKKNSDYNHHVTGLGLDQFFGLQQKQSGNHQHDGLYIGFTKLERSNVKNTAAIPDQTFLLWGDNGKTQQFDDPKEQPYATMGKQWKMQVTSKSQAALSPKTQLLIDKKEMVFSGVEKLGTQTWLVIDSSSSKLNFATAQYYKTTRDTKENLVFDNVSWKNNGNSFFTWVKAPAFFVVSDVSFTACQSGNTKKGILKLAIAGGVAPFSISIQSEQFEKELSVTDRNTTLTDLSFGNYTVVVTDAMQAKYTTSFVVDAYHTDVVQLDKTYLKEDTKPLVITPTVIDAERIASYEWLFEGASVSKETTYTAEDIGNYTLMVTTKEGCKVELPFQVTAHKPAMQSPWVIYPNPVEYGQTYSLQFALAKASAVQYSIHDLNGKIIKMVDLGTIKEHLQVENPLPIGNYLITISIDGKTETTKLIIK